VREARTKVCSVVVRNPNGKKGRVKVTAQYFRITEGALVFRNYVPDNYPETVRVFAPGYWLEVVPHG